MKLNPKVSSSRRKNRRRLFNAPSHVRQKIMCCALSKALCKRYGVPRMALPIHRDDEVKVVRGKFKEEAPSKVINVNRRSYRLKIESCQRDKANGVQVKVPVHFSNVIITKLKLDPYRKRLIYQSIKKKLNGRRNLGLVTTRKEKKAATTDLD